MFRMTNVNLIITITCEIVRFKNTCGDRRRKHFTIPISMILLENLSWIFTRKDFLYTFLYEFKCLPISTSSECRYLFFIIIVFVRVPITLAYTLNQICANAIAFNGK